MSNNQVLSDLIKFRNENIKDNRDSSLIYISTANMNPERNGISLEDNDSLGKSGKKFYKGDVLVSNIRPYFKKIWKADRDGISSADVLNFIPIEEDMIDKTYLYYLLSADTFFGYMTATAKGTKMPRGDKKALEKYEVRSLKLSEQKLIANILSSFDDKIENNNAIIANLEEQAQTIFKSWFNKFEPFQEVGFMESELGEIPKEWQVKTLDELVKLSRKNFKPKKSEEKNVYHFSIPAYDNSRYPVFDQVETIKSNKYIIDDSSILVSKLNPSVSRVWLPNIKEGELNVCSTEFLVLNTSGSETKSFIYEVSKSLVFSEHLISHATGSTNSRQRVKPQVAMDFKIACHPRIIQKFGRIVKPFHQEILNLRDENTRLEEIRDTLLPKLMSGEIRVEEAIEVI